MRIICAFGHHIYRSIGFHEVQNLEKKQASLLDSFWNKSMHPLGLDRWNDGDDKQQLHQVIQSVKFEINIRTQSSLEQWKKTRGCLG